MKILQNPTVFKWLRLSAAFMISGQALTATAAVNDVVPGDFFPLKPGSSTFAAYLYDRDSNGPYAAGKSTFDGRLDTQILALRLGHFFELAGKPLSLIVVLPWAKATVSPAPLAAALGDEASGLGDIRLGATQWLMVDREGGDYLAVSGMVSLPTGEYAHRQIISIGENRWKTTLSLGWIKTINPYFMLEVVPEFAWYGDNDDYLNGNTFEQKTSSALTGYLRYRASPQWQFHIGSQWNRGGKTRVNDIDNDDAPDTRRGMLGATYTSEDRKNQWMLRMAKDLKIENGFRTKRELMLRYLRVF